MKCDLKNVEVMGRDVSIISSHDGATTPIIRSIIDADNKIDLASETISFRIKKNKLFLFNKETEKRLYL